MDQFDLYLSQLQKVYHTDSKSTKFDTFLPIIDKLKDLTAHYNLSNASVDKDSFFKIRAFLEIYALIFLESNDTDHFRCFYSQLQPFYFDLTHDLSAVSTASYSHTPNCSNWTYNKTLTRPETLDFVSYYNQYKLQQGALTHPFFTDLFDCPQVDSHNGNSRDDNIVDVINVNLVPENLVDFTYEEVNFMSAQTKQYFNIM